MIKSRYSRGLAISLLLLTTCGIGACAAQQKPVNVLFIAIDDLRVQYGPYDLDQALTPNIDTLASEGVAFTRAYSNVPICGASRASMLTGVRPSSTRFVTFESASEQAPQAVTLPQQFKNNGYYTISLGKIFNNPGDKTPAFGGQGSLRPAPYNSWGSMGSLYTTRIVSRVWRT